MKPCSFASESLVLPFISHSISRPHQLMAVWQSAPHHNQGHANPSDHGLNAEVWSAAVSSGQRHWYQKASSLEVLMLKVVSACRPAAQTGVAGKGFKKRAFEVALFLPDAQFKQLQVACRPEWSAQDIEAECWLEAALQMQQDIRHLALDFKVHLTPDGQLCATAMVCAQTCVQNFEQQFSQWGMKLAILSSHSQARVL
jgi:hypothetical protein